MKKKLKVFDVFPFFNELDLLEIRLNILNDYVDFFIISESTKTFSGLEKPLYYLENKNKFDKFNHKIIHNVVKDNHIKIHPYDRDVFQKNEIKKILLNHVSDDDAILFGDLDEVPNPDVVSELDSFFEKDTIYHFAQENCISYLNLVELTGSIQAMTLDFDYGDERRRWLGTKLIGKQTLDKYTITELRHWHSNEKNARIFPGGWHWSYVGSEGLSVEERIVKKIECAAHQESNTEQIKKNVSRIKNNKDPIGRDYAVYEVVSIEDNYPEYIVKNKEKYSYIIKEQ